MEYYLTHLYNRWECDSAEYGKTDISTYILTGISADGAALNLQRVTVELWHGKEEKEAFVRSFHDWRIENALKKLGEFPIYWKEKIT